MDKNRLRELADLEQLNEGKNTLMFSEYQTKFCEAVLKDVAKKLDKRIEGKVTVHRKDNRSMATLDLKGYTRSDTEFSGQLMIIMDAPAGSGKNLVKLNLKGVTDKYSKSDDILTFRNNDVVDTKNIAKTINEKTEHTF